MNRDSLGDRCKLYERLSAGPESVPPHAPMIARMDGRCFSTWTRGLPARYAPLQQLFDNVTIELVHRTGACFAHTYSDEITLVWSPRRQASDHFMGGKPMKLASTLSSMTTALFRQHLEDYLPTMWFDAQHQRLATFDARVFSVPNESEARNVVLWRVQDAARNSLQGFAREFFSHKELQGKNSSDMHEMLREKGHNWALLPDRDREGGFLVRVRDRGAVPAPEGISPFSSVLNPCEVIFEGAEPQRYEPEMAEASFQRIGEES